MKGGVCVCGWVFAAGVCAEFHDHSFGFMNGLCVYLCCRCVCWTSWSPLKVYEVSVCVFVWQVCVLNFMITPQSSWRVCVCICAAGVCAGLHDHPSKFMKGLCVYLCCRCVYWTSWSPLKVHEGSVCVFVLQVCVLNFMITPQSSWRVCVCICAAGVCAELHDHPSRPGRPAAGHCGSQGEAGVGGEEEWADHRECWEPEAAEGDWRQDSWSPVQLTGERNSPPLIQLTCALCVWWLKGNAGKQASQALLRGME